MGLGHAWISGLRYACVNVSRISWKICVMDASESSGNERNEK